MTREGKCVIAYIDREYRVRPRILYAKTGRKSTVVYPAPAQGPRPINLSVGIVLARNMMNEKLRPMQFFWKRDAGVCCERKYCLLGEAISFVVGLLERECYHINPSSPIPGKPATLTPKPPKPAAAMWLLSFSSGLHGGECCR